MDSSSGIPNNLRVSSLQTLTFNQIRQMFTPLTNTKFWQNSIDPSPKEHRFLVFVGKGFFFVNNINNPQDNFGKITTQINSEINSENSAYFPWTDPCWGFGRRSGDRYRHNPQLSYT